MPPSGNRPTQEDSTSSTYPLFPGQFIQYVTWVWTLSFRSVSQMRVWTSRAYNKFTFNYRGFGPTLYLRKVQKFLRLLGYNYVNPLSKVNCSPQWLLMKTYFGNSESFCLAFFPWLAVLWWNYARKCMKTLGFKSTKVLLSLFIWKTIEIILSL